MSFLGCDAPWHHRNYTLTPLVFNYNGNVIFFCTDADVDWIYEMVRLLPALDEQLVSCYCWIRMSCYYFCPRCTMTPLKLHTSCLLSNYWQHRIDDTLLCTDVDMERYRVGFDRTERTLALLLYIWIWMFHCLVNDTHLLHIHYATVSCWLWMNRKYVSWYCCMFEFECIITSYTYDASWHHRDCTLACYSTTPACYSNIQQWWLCATLCWCQLNTYIAYILWNDMVLALDEQNVR